MELDFIRTYDPEGTRERSFRKAGPFEVVQNRTPWKKNHVGKGILTGPHNAGWKFRPS